jgi:mRNA-degrading endonuclease toxin of MazEF toxin-antitoxin module
MPRVTCPSRGDIVWLDFDPQVGHEQAGRRPAVVLSHREYNLKTGLAIVCPMTSQVDKGWPFTVKVAEGSEAAAPRSKAASTTPPCNMSSRHSLDSSFRSVSSTSPPHSPQTTAN